MMRRAAFLAIISLVLSSFIGCDPPAPPPAVAADFLGTWQLTPVGGGAPVMMVLQRAATRTSPAGASLDFEGRYATNSRIMGSATGGIFAGTAVYGNTARGLKMTIIGPNQAEGTWSDGSRFIGVRMP